MVPDWGVSVFCEFLDASPSLDYPFVMGLVANGDFRAVLTGFSPRTGGKNALAGDGACLLKQHLSRAPPLGRGNSPLNRIARGLGEWLVAVEGLAGAAMELEKQRLATRRETQKELEYLKRMMGGRW